MFEKIELRPSFRIRSGAGGSGALAVLGAGRLCFAFVLWRVTDAWVQNFRADLARSGQRWGAPSMKTSAMSATTNLFPDEFPIGWAPALGGLMRPTPLHVVPELQSRCTEALRSFLYCLSCHQDERRRWSTPDSQCECHTALARNLTPGSQTHYAQDVGVRQVKLHPNSVHAGFVCDKRWLKFNHKVHDVRISAAPRMARPLRWKSRFALPVALWLTSESAGLAPQCKSCHQSTVALPGAPRASRRSA